jgi:GT2 family glycosyltransferase
MSSDPQTEFKIRVVVATRESERDFFEQTATGRSLTLYSSECLQARVFPKNKVGLSKVYNIAIREAVKEPALLVFAHDDLHILDYYWVDQLAISLRQFQLVGLAGNKRRVPGQSGWAFLDDKCTCDDPENFSGMVGHGTSFPPENLSFFGLPRQEVKLLDGLLLACHSKTLIDSDIRFDEHFDFHHYDIDLCRQAEMKGLKMGTCPLSVIHESAGNFGTAPWIASYRKYIGKWGS